MSVISKRFADELDDPEMRHAYLAAQTRTKVANQIRALRAQRGWTQSRLGEEMGGVPQGNVARLEDREKINARIDTLVELAAAYDVGLIIEFVNYRDFLIRTRNLSPEALQVPSFTQGSLAMLTGEKPHQVASSVASSNASIQVFQIQSGQEQPVDAGIGTSSISVISAPPSEIPRPVQELPA